ncbi:histidine phosphatase family protein [Billgrantia kenyensis]|uniref:Histidine phosphatase family protein n=1 Tax=Billgrantia kenyensis TaxID=321266 RepID=A0A7V9VY43_9GAMM|nr:histidine phosphatase family protein [Halomonas kenyensis]MBA2777583.1 histidine phosphatase family protein [Halomonas kenyensis]MCG6660253.1 histidine phosphatase family protein [Halomonas kenyensis]
MLLNKLKRRLLASLLPGSALLVLVCLPATAEEHLSVEPSPGLLSALQQGGFVLYLRHAPTDTSIPDQVPVDFDDCTTQRPLSGEGRQVVKDVAEHMARHAWPIEDPIIVSPFCRTQETARILFPDKPQQIDTMLRYTAAMTDDEKRPVIDHTGKMLSLPVEGNANRMIVAHGPNLADLMDYFPPEGTLVIFSPLDEEGYLYHASIPPDLWASLAFEAP